MWSCFKKTDEVYDPSERTDVKASRGETLVELRATITSLETALKERDAEKNEIIAEKDAVIAAKNTVIANRDATIAQLSAQLGDQCESDDTETENEDYVLWDANESDSEYAYTYVKDKETYVTLDVLINARGDAKIDEAKEEDAHDTKLIEDPDVSSEIYDELFPAKPISTKPSFAGTFPRQSDFKKPMELLGKGAYGLVFRSELAGTPVVLKVSKTRSSQAGADDYREWSVSEQLKAHPNVMRIIGLCPSFSHPMYPTAGTTAIVMPMQENGPLGAFLKKGTESKGIIEYCGVESFLWVILQTAA